MVKLKGKVKYLCGTCNYKFIIKYTGWYPTIKCPKCGESAHMVRNLGVSTVYIKNKSKQPVAFWRTPKGIVGSDGKGNIIDPKDTKYDLKKDPHGWKAIGKKVKNYN